MDVLKIKDDFAVTLEAESRTEMPGFRWKASFALCLQLCVFKASQPRRLLKTENTVKDTARHPRRNAN